MKWLKSQERIWDRILESIQTQGRKKGGAERKSKG